MEKEELFKQLRDAIKNRHKNDPVKTRIDRIEVDDDFEELLEMTSTKTTQEAIYCIKNNDSPFNHLCPICGNPCKFDINKMTYLPSCRSNECLCKILLKNDKIKSSHQIIIDRYLNGGKQFTRLQIGLIEKYGVYTNSQIGDWHDKMKNAYQKMTKDDLKRRREKTIKTCREKYGTDFSQQNADIRKKQSDTWHSKSKEATNETTKRRKQTCIEKYGVDHVMKSQEILEEVKQRHLKENGYYHWIQKNIEHKDIYMDDEKFKQFIMSKYEENGHKKVKKTELDDFFNVDVIGKCKSLNLMDYIEVRRSPLEEMIKKLLDENGVKYEWRNRSIIDGPNGKSHCLELDLYLPDYKIGIEINDLANHSVNPIRNAGLIANNKEYHLYKTKNCSEKGVRLIHIWEWELKKNFEKLSRWLLNELDDSKKKVFARKCEVKAVSPDEEKQFLDEFHLQGYAKSETCYGLYFNDELVQVMSFVKSRYDKKYQHEILRLCTKNGYAVVGGAARLLKHFIKEKDPESIISYCDYSKFDGSSYEKIGMKLEKLSKPTAYYCNFDMHVINESMLMRYGVDNILGTDYGKGTDNKELIMKHGYLPVYNCGNLIFTWRKGLN